MQFTQLEFLLFWVCVLVTVWGVDRLARTPQPRHCVLLAASYYFYAYWDWRFCLLLAASTAVDFMLARAMNSVHGLRLRRMLLVGSVVFNLGLLGFFKYCNFFIESAAAVLEPRAIATGTLDVVLPVGISFFTFQTLSYSIDVYRRRIEPCKSILDFSLYVAFFPQLVAGPIVRATELMPQFARKPDFSSRRLYAGVQCVLRGLVKKVLIADRLGEMVDVVFEGPELYHGITVWLAIIAYAGQIYYDFSGYTDIAIGVAKTLGYRFP
ncbi:MAG: MBOAT family O-acyltransferase, partial [Planctomycetota bacterium]